MAYAQKGMYEKALEIVTKNLGEGHWVHGYISGLAGKREKAVKGINNRIENSEQSYVSPAIIAFLYVGIGEREKALDWLGKAYEEGDMWLRYLKVAPIYDSLRSEPRFKALLQRMNFPD